MNIDIVLIIGLVSTLLTRKFIILIIQKHKTSIYAPPRQDYILVTSSKSQRHHGPASSKFQNVIRQKPHQTPPGMPAGATP